MATTPQDWDAMYVDGAPPPWDIGRPQAAFVRLAAEGLLSGTLLDAGCGTGEHTLLAAIHGADALGVDVSRRAIEQARRKASERGIRVGFEVADVLALGREPTFDTILDSGLFHVFDDDDARDRYVTSLASLLRAGGNCYLMCFSDRQPGDLGPRRVRRDEITTAFRDGWIVESIVPDAFEINPPRFGTSIAQAWLASIRRQPLVANANSARL
jgi:cyclopropane fatty-acyl-phospholipid synthase-like methyltransferase